MNMLVPQYAFTESEIEICEKANHKYPGITDKYTILFLENYPRKQICDMFQNKQSMFKHITSIIGEYVCSLLSYQTTLDYIIFLVSKYYDVLDIVNETVVLMFYFDYLSKKINPIIHIKGFIACFSKKYDIVRTYVLVIECALLISDSGIFNFAIQMALKCDNLIDKIVETICSSTTIYFVNHFCEILEKSTIIDSYIRTSSVIEIIGNILQNINTRELTLIWKFIKLYTENIMSDIVQTYYVYTIVGGIIGTTTIQIDSETLKSKLFEHSIKGEYKHCCQNIIFKLTKREKPHAWEHTCTLGMLPNLFITEYDMFGEIKVKCMLAVMHIKTQYFFVQCASDRFNEKKLYIESLIVFFKTNVPLRLNLYLFTPLFYECILLIALDMLHSEQIELKMLILNYIITIITKFKFDTNYIFKLEKILNLFPYSIYLEKIASCLVAFNMDKDNSNLKQTYPNVF